MKSFSSRDNRLRDLHSFPTRRSSDLGEMLVAGDIDLAAAQVPELLAVPGVDVDRKSTRLNSSHPSMSYAVFCLKKKSNKSGKWTVHAVGRVVLSAPGLAGPTTDFAIF